MPQGQPPAELPIYDSLGQAQVLLQKLFGASSVEGFCLQALRAREPRPTCCS